MEGDEDNYLGILSEPKEKGHYVLRVVMNGDKLVEDLSDEQRGE